MKIYIHILLTIVALLVYAQSTFSQTIEVKGKLIDVAEVEVNAYVFPQNRTFRFKAPVPEHLIGKRFATSLIEYDGASQVRSDKKCVLYIAYVGDNLSADGWKPTNEEFMISSARKYNLYKYEYKNENEWITIPAKSRKNNAPTLLFANEIKWADHKQVPGSIITQTETLKKIHLTNPTITILPDGDYLAATSGNNVEPGEKRGTSFYISSDKGKTWKLRSGNSLIINYGNLFVHNNTLYMMGTRAPRSEVIICKSDNKGKTWTQAKNANSGLILKGKYHSAPVPMVVHGGRIWRAMETNDKKGSQKEAFVMSAPADSDLLKASNWTVSDKMTYQKDWISGDGRSFKQWLEGNVVVDRQGNIVNVLRVDEEKMGGVAAIITVDKSGKLSFDPQKDIINFPGGGKKFTIRFDEQTNKYWALSNPVFEEDRDKKHSGIYKDGMHCGLIRNHLVLMHSDDLRNWTVKDTLITSNDPFFHGFQYVDWQFDGDDIIAVSRTAFDEERGLPTRQHDANYFTFHRFKDFRNARIQTIVIKE